MSVKGLTVISEKTESRGQSEAIGLLYWEQSSPSIKA